MRPGAAQPAAGGAGTGGCGCGSGSSPSKGAHGGLPFLCVRVFGVWGDVRGLKKRDWGDESKNDLPTLTWERMSLGAR